MKFGSWTYNGFQVDVTNRTGEVDLKNYVKNGEWELQQVRNDTSENVFLLFSFFSSFLPFFA